MIIETIVTTLDDVGELNVAPMGAVMESSIDNDAGATGERGRDDRRWFELRPFQSAATFHNLKSRGEGVLHIVDDCRLIVRAALGLELPELATRPADEVRGRVLIDSCRGFEFRVRHCVSSEARAVLTCEVVKSHWFRDAAGFCRAKFAAIEVAILASRADFLPAEEIESQLAHYRPIVEKTGSQSDRQAFADVEKFLTDGEFLRGGHSVSNDVSSDATD